MTAIRKRLYDSGVLPARHLHGPGISLRNISAGGPGKTPFVPLLWYLFTARGLTSHVLTSGASPESFPLAGKLVWRARRGIIPKDIPPRPIVFCGIARPQNFVLQLRAANIEPVAEAFYRDHHAYTEKDIRELLDLKQRSEAGGFVTTEKDAINLGGYLSALQPLSIVPVKMDLTDAANAIDTMLRMIHDRKRPA